MKGEYYINLSGIYDGFLSEIDCRDISGTNCYCDDVARKTLEERLKDIPVDALHFMDSGNYHYLSYFFLRRIKKEFALILFDHHPDCQLPSFGEILSCGGWVKNAWEELPNLKEVYMVGVDRMLFENLADVPEKVKWLDVQNLEKLKSKLPVYVSIDKDVLSTEFASCDWDQGDMTDTQLMEALEWINRSYPVLGVDVCGEKKEAPTEKERMQNLEINDRIRKVFFL
jgi:arginase family enzyme